MASRLEDDLCCPVCQDVFKDPVLSSCGHSFCFGCSKDWWRENVGRVCPLCRKRCAKGRQPLNSASKNSCESFLQQRDQRASEDLCSSHSEKLKLFCSDHQQPVCLVCRDSEKHVDHKFKPIDEAAPDHKKNLQETLQSLKKKSELRKKVLEEFDSTAEHVKVQARHAERQIKKQFNSLHEFLAEEEEARSAASREEEEQKSGMMKEKMEASSREIAALSDTVRATEEESRAEDVSFSHNYKAAVERVQRCPSSEDPQSPSGASIDQAKHSGNSAFNIWSNMKDKVSYTPVSLDPNTAFPFNHVTDDLTSYRRGPGPRFPDNPERYCNSIDCVSGSEGFNSGKHSWDVEVDVSRHWSLGVSPESAPRKPSQKAGCFLLGFFNSKYTASSPTPPFSVLPFRKNVQRVRVDSDWDGGKSSFSDPDTNTHIHTFTHTFTEKSFPLFSSMIGVKLLPMDVLVVKRQPEFGAFKDRPRSRGLLGPPADFMIKIGTKKDGDPRPTGTIIRLAPVPAGKN